MHLLPMHDHCPLEKNRLCATHRPAGPARKLVCSSPDVNLRGYESSNHKHKECTCTNLLCHFLCTIEPLHATLVGANLHRGHHVRVYGSHGERVGCVVPLKQCHLWLQLRTECRVLLAQPTHALGPVLKVFAGHAYETEIARRNIAGLQTTCHCTR